MNHRKLLSLVLVVLAVTFLVFGSGGFSAMETERNVHVSVVDSERAYLAVEPLDPDGVSPPNNEEVALFDVTNNLDGDLEISVRPLEETHPGPVPKLKDFEQHGKWPASLGPNESGTVYGVPVCKGVNETVSNTIEFEIVAHHTDRAISIMTIQTVTITCEPELNQRGDDPNQSGNSSEPSWDDDLEYDTKNVSASDDYEERNR